jgi:hypothetical protein
MTYNHLYNDKYNVNYYDGFSSSDNDDSNDSACNDNHRFSWSEWSKIKSNDPTL